MWRGKTHRSSPGTSLRPPDRPVGARKTYGWREIREIEVVNGSGQWPERFSALVNGSGQWPESISALGNGPGQWPELLEQYALGCYPEPRRNDGSWREVKVEIAGRGFKIRAREGYVDH